MGKKNKLVGGSKKIVVNHLDIPEEQRRTWVIDETKDVLESYNDLLNWIRMWGCKDGSDFDGIRNIAFLEGYPLIEVGVECGARLGRFLMSRGSLYIHAFYTRTRGWRIYDDTELEIQGKFTRLQMSAQYVSKPWAVVGPKSLIKALGDLDNDDGNIASKGCQVFMVHLSEAARLLLVQSTILLTLIPSPSNLDPAKFPEDNIDLVGNDEEYADILDLLRPVVVDLSKSSNAPSQVQYHIKNFAALSRIWFIYSLSQKKLHPLDVSLAKNCGIRTVLSLRHALSILSNTNLTTKVYMECEKLVGENFTQNDLDLMRYKIESLQAPKQVDLLCGEKSDSVSAPGELKLMDTVVSAKYEEASEEEKLHTQPKVDLLREASEEEKERLRTQPKNEKKRKGKAKEKKSSKSSKERFRVLGFPSIMYFYLAGVCFKQ